VFNIADAVVDPGIVDIQAYVQTRWPFVPNCSVANQCLLSTEKAQSILGYKPFSGGSYIESDLVW
jgi:hypothetical protein